MSPSLHPHSLVDSTAEFMQTNGVKKVHTCIIFDDGSAAKISYGDGYSKAYAV